MPPIEFELTEAEVELEATAKKLCEEELGVVLSLEQFRNFMRMQILKDASESVSLTQ